MSKYIGSEEKVVKAGEKLNFENLSKSPVTVGTAVMFNKDGIYICDVLNGKVRITCGDQAKVKRGEWGEKLWWHICSQCGYYYCHTDDEGEWQATNFCPNCGADMREKENEN